MHYIDGLYLCTMCTIDRYPDALVEAEASLAEKDAYIATLKAEITRLVKEIKYWKLHG